MRAQVIGGLPSDLVGSLTGLTQGRFPIHAKATYAGQLDEKGNKVETGNAAMVVESDEARRGIDIFSRQGAPVITVNDGKVVEVGKSKRLGKFVMVQDVYGNTYTYGHLGAVETTYPAPKDRSKRDGKGRVEHESAKPEKDAPKELPAADETAPDAAATPMPTKERLFAHPNRPAARPPAAPSRSRRRPTS